MLRAKLLLVQINQFSILFNEKSFSVEKKLAIAKSC